MAHESRFRPRRPLGRTAFVASPLGVGDLADRALGKERCVSVLRRALDHGLNVVDTAPSYEDGFSEEVVGEAVRDRRDRVFVIDKIDHLDRPLEPQLDESEARLGFAPDAFVFHGISTREQLSDVLSGPMERLRDRVRYRGVSSHHPEIVAAAIDSGTCDLLMFAIGPFADARYASLLARAKASGIGTVCFKTFGAGKLLGDSEGYGRPSSKQGLPRLTVDECVRYTLTLDPDVALLGLSDEEEQDAAFAAAARFTAYSPEELADVRRRAADAVRDKGKIWWDPPAP
ncbi:MAG: aldo/keto reductase [Deltaproteobacteria bacterium]|nr:aldo/keto reductase [Deltaproteobacteria bacterium]